MGYGNSWEVGAAGSSGERSSIACAYLGASPPDRQEAGKGPGMLSPQIPVPLTAVSPGTWPMSWWTGVAQEILIKP